MRYFATAVAVGSISIASFMMSPIASAQVGVEVGVPGVGVRIGEPAYPRERRRTRVYEENTGVVDCRTVTIRRERADGTIVTRRERRCD